MNKTKQIILLVVSILALVLLALIIAQFTTVRVSAVDGALVEACRIYAGHTVAILRYTDGTRAMAFTAGTPVCWFNW